MAFSYDQQLFSSSENVTIQALDVSFLNAVILVTLTSLVFLLSCITLFVYYQWRVCRHIVETRIGIVVFFLGILLATLTTLSSSTEQTVYAIYRLALLIGCGMVVFVVGCAVLFENASPERPLDDYGYERLPVGYLHGSMGIIIWVITLPLSILEVVFVIGAAKQAPNPTYAAVRIASLIQKIVQASVYHFSLRHKVARADLRMACSWLLKIISFFNFAFWIDSIATAHNDNDWVVNLFGNGFSIVKAAYNALLIDYRLLCCLLFLEHALELTEVRTNRRIGEIFNPDASEALMHDSFAARVDVEISHSSGYGYVVGLILVATQLVAGLQYLDFVGKWANIFPIIANIVVIVFGLLLLYGSVSIVTDNGFDNHNSKWRETESKAIDVMVCFMGAIGFIYWFVKASFCGLWAFTYSSASSADAEFHQYLTWTTLKNFTYAITILFQISFFIKMGPHYGCDRESSRQKAKHFYVTTIMMALLSLLISFVVDEYNGRVEKLLDKAHISKTMLSFLQTAAPIHLGFSLHMFLHFFIMNRRLSQFQYRRLYKQFENSRNRQQSSTGTSDNNDEGREERQPLISQQLASMPQT